MLDSRIYEIIYCIILLELIELVHCWNLASILVFHQARFLLKYRISPIYFSNSKSAHIWHVAATYFSISTFWMQGIYYITITRYLSFQLETSTTTSINNHTHLNCSRSALCFSSISRTILRCEDSMASSPFSHNPRSCSISCW